MSPITWIAAHVCETNTAAACGHSTSARHAEMNMVCSIHVARNAAWRAYRDAGGLSSRRQFLRALRERYPWQVVTLLP